MPSFMPLLPGDPERLGGLDLLGRLGEGGQGVVYLARTPMEAYVAVKWLRPDQSGDEESVERFLREAQVAQRVASFCTADVLSTGVQHGRPYIMSEYVEGPSLDRVVRQEGPRTGPALDRLAIGTATALAAIHEGQVVHRDFKPGNVIMAGDGPRVIDFGIARTLDPVQMTSSTQIGTPAYMSPEQIRGTAIGPAADMFSWAATIVFASCGRAPFGHDGTHTVMQRVLHEQPDLGTLDGPLREVAAQCLAKDPARRPTAKTVMMRLLRRSGPEAEPVEEGGGPTPVTPPAAAPPSVPQRPARALRRKTVVVGAAVVTALLLTVAGVAAAGLMTPTGGAAQPTAPSASAPSKATTPAPRPTATPVDTDLPGGAELFERPADPIRLMSYSVNNEKTDEDVYYARKLRRGTFGKHAGILDSLVSPDGRYHAVRQTDYTSDGYDSVLITNGEAGVSFRVKTVRDPLESTITAWSGDSSKILLNVTRPNKNAQGEKGRATTGFAIVEVDRADLARSKVNVVEVNDATLGNDEFGWDARGEGVIYFHEKIKGLRFYDASGRPTRDVPGVGALEAGAELQFSPSGRTFVTDCHDGEADGDHCLWDTATGKQARTFSSDCDKVLGWFGEDHLFCWEQDNGANDEIQVVTLDGKLVRRLLDVPKDLDLSPRYAVNPSS
ncbi:serine/threonine protein kinase [Nonomuraea diastatica]|uniref:Serine/threonine protein kinase n=1 Tax=Nonomuraea diastatica TaxID=1848329 RepID=A0A4R4X694_9ACTN|nr:serine/threonine-protein kinase [Nonomuraea diastatica]TDD25918.1 serine/threonine protein kinase [Nonomuraea diastatica]